MTDLIEFEEALGRVEEYDPATQRAKIRIDQGALRVGDIIQIMGATDEPADVVTIQDLLLADDPVQQAAAGAVVEVPVPRPVSYLDDVFLVTPR